jgi:hypothetical protein
MSTVGRGLVALADADTVESVSLCTIEVGASEFMAI